MRAVSGFLGAAVLVAGLLGSGGAAAQICEPGAGKSGSVALGASGYTRLHARVELIHIGGNPALAIE